LLLDQGIGTFIAPKPNRLVLMNQDVFHCVKPVLPAAGREFRLSVSGFFLKN
jgi:Rps23 Pro-64 3,4-dihydroxylase Tpa1-like proline 4-hydroxylase